VHSRRVRLLVAFVPLLAACARKAPVLPPALFPAKPGWTTAIGEPIEGPLASDGARVYVATRDGKLRALDAGSGAIAWTRALAPGTTVGAAEGLVIARQPDGLVVRLAPDDGRELWSTDARVTGAVAPTLERGRVFVAGQGVAALDAADGRLVWGAPGTPAVVRPPVAAGAQILVSEDDGTLRGRDRDTGLPSWTRRMGPALAAAPVADDQRIYVGTREREFLALRPKDGARRWRWRLGADVDAPAAVSGRVVLFASLEGVLYALGRGNGHMVWRATLPSRPLSGPLLVGAAVLVACRETDVVAFALADGQRLGAMKTPGEMRTTPLVLGDRFVVGLRYPWVVASLQLDLTPKKPAAAATRGTGRRGRDSQRTPPAATPAPTPAPDGVTATPSPSPPAGFQTSAQP
jgi:outer membrane protein assembly factor BamB